MKRRAVEIPEDVLFEILIRLPVKSLCKLRAVSTSWLRIISDPSFISSHYDVAKNRPRLLLVDSIGRSAGPTWGRLVYDADGSKLVEAVRVPNSPDSDLRYSPSPSVRGLICLGSGRDHIGILNPSTQEYTSIPLPPFCGPYGRTDTPYTCFGFDSLANKHKLLFSRVTTSSLGPEHRRLTEHWLFTLGSGSGERWRRVGISEHHAKCDSHPEVCIDGVMYFLVGKLETPYSQFSLAAFDLRSESCQLKLIGSGMDFVSTCKLIEFDGQVALVHSDLHYRYHPAAGPRRIDVWVSGDSHKQDWAVKRSVWAPDSWLEVIHRQGLSLACALRGGQLLVFKPCPENGSPNLDLFFYNVESSRFWATRIHIPEGDVLRNKGACRAVMCCEHIESLLPLKAP